MINSDHGSPNISKAKLMGQSERLWCVCFMFSTSSLPSFFLLLANHKCRHSLILFSNQETKAEMLEEWEVAAGFTKALHTAGDGRIESDCYFGDQSFVRHFI